MRYIFKFPDIGEGLDEGTIFEWYISKGQTIQSGDPLVNMETDKVVTDLPSPKTGTIIEIFGKVGDTVRVGDPLVEIEVVGVQGADAQDGANSSEESLEEKEEVVVGTFDIAGNNAFLPASKEGMDHQAPVKNYGKSISTPVARALAKELKVDINEVQGSGPAGRVMKEDIHAFYNRTNGQPEVEGSGVETPNRVLIEPLTQIRKTIAKNMINSKHNAAHMHAFEEVDASELIRLRAKFKDKFKSAGISLSYLPFILKATSYALKKHPVLNSEMDLENNRMIYKKYYNLGIAVDTPNGLMVPVIKNVDQCSLFELATSLNDIAVKTRERRITLEDLKGGTFTITNFGSIGGLWATPLINYPEAAILGIGKMIQKPVIKNDEIVKGDVMPISLSLDHRIVDGGEASRFLNTLVNYLEDPASLLME